MLEESGVALVGVKHLRLRRSGDLGIGTHGADTADAEQHLLLEPVLGAAAVELVGGQLVVVAARCPRCWESSISGTGSTLAPHTRWRTDRPVRQSHPHPACGMVVHQVDGQAGGSATDSSPVRCCGDSDGEILAVVILDSSTIGTPRSMSPSSGHRRGFRARRDTAAAPRSHRFWCGRRSGPVRPQALIPAVGRQVVLEIVGRRRRGGAAGRSPASVCSRRGETAPSSRTGSPSQSCHTFGSTSANRSRVSACQDQRRLTTRSDSACSSRGRVVRTVNRRSAFIGESLSRLAG